MNNQKENAKSKITDAAIEWIGNPIFKEVEGRLKLRLIKSRTFPCGIVVLNYQQV